MEIKRRPVAKTVGAILLMALSTNTLAAYYCNPNGDSGQMICHGQEQQQQVYPRGFYGDFLRGQENAQKRQLMQQEIELRQLELEQRRQQLVDQELQKEWQQLNEHKRRRQTDKQPMRPQIFGARVAPISDEFGSSLQPSAGALVEAVAQGGPAFKANIMRGDVIIEFADKPIVTVENLIDILPTYAGQKVPVRVIRGTRTLDIDVQLGDGW